jgi:hypothetical protein
LELPNAFSYNLIQNNKWGHNQNLLESKLMFHLKNIGTDCRSNSFGGVEILTRDYSQVSDYWL